MKIQKPTICRAVEYTDNVGERWAATVVGVREGAAPGVVDLVCFEMGGGPPALQSLRYEACSRFNVPFDTEGSAITWRYPPRSDEMIEVATVPRA